MTRLLFLATSYCIIDRRLPHRGLHETSPSILFVAAENMFVNSYGCCPLICSMHSFYRVRVCEINACIRHNVFFIFFSHTTSNSIKHKNCYYYNYHNKTTFISTAYPSKYNYYDNFIFQLRDFDTRIRALIRR